MSSEQFAFKHLFFVCVSHPDQNLIGLFYYSEMAEDTYLTTKQLAE